jgi:tRNA-dihydrouridine synthase 4
MGQPQLVHDMVAAARASTSQVRMADGSRFPISIKIRIHAELERTLEFVRLAEEAGVAWITVHGRTRKQRHADPVDYEAIRRIKAHACVPIFANGDVFTAADVERICALTAVDGVMSARGLLENPCLFAGYTSTPLEAVKEYVRLAVGYGTNSFLFQHHLAYMLEGSMTRQERKHFNSLSSIPSILDFLEGAYGIVYEGGDDSEASS